MEEKIETTTILSLLKRTQICKAQVRHIQSRCESAGQGGGIPGFCEGLVFGQVTDGCTLRIAVAILVLAQNEPLIIIRT